jgi:N-acetylglucosaminyldiphosphoundecaprenol N-acetyl-beta-D-mannosaminyltransferase
MDRLSDLKSENILGTRVHTLSLEETVSLLSSCLLAKSEIYVSLTPFHSLIDGDLDPQARAAFNNAALTLPDGMGVVWLQKLKGHRNLSRVYGPDLLVAMVERGLNQGLKHYFLGAASEVGCRLKTLLEARYPEMQIVGVNSPDLAILSAREEEALIEQINNSRADILWVAFGSPKQDIWMARNRAELRVPVIIGVGAAFDFIVGVKRQAPSWIQRLGFEWLFRLLTEPRRLWSRYRRYPGYLIRVLVQFLGLKKYPTGIEDLS